MEISEPFPSIKVLRPKRFGDRRGFFSETWNRRSLANLGIEIVYKCSDYYAPKTEGAVLWNDPEIGINWPLTGEAILSGKDVEATLLVELESPFTWEGAQ